MQTSFGTIAMEEAVSKKQFKRIFELARVDVVDELSDTVKEIMSHGGELTEDEFN